MIAQDLSLSTIEGEILSYHVLLWHKLKHQSQQNYKFIENIKFVSNRNLFLMEEFSIFTGYGIDL